MEKPKPAISIEYERIKIPSNETEPEFEKTWVLTKEQEDMLQGTQAIKCTICNTACGEFVRFDMRFFCMICLKRMSDFYLKVMGKTGK